MAQPTNDPSLRVRAAEEIVLTAAAAAWGLASGISLATWWIAPAPPDQLPGYMKAAGLDAHGPLLAVLTVIVATLAAPLIARPFVSRVARGHHWANIASTAALTFALWPAIADPFDHVFSVVVPAAIALVFMLLRDFDPRFTRRDVVLVPASLALFICITTVAPRLGVPQSAYLAAAVVVFLRIAIASERFRGRLDPASCFAPAPLAIVFEVPVLFANSVVAMVASVVLLAGSPALMRLTLHDSETARRRSRWLLVFVALPLFAIAYPQTYNPVSVDGIPRVNFFEDGHNLMPASEMMRGERPYRDFVPGHGLISDGLLDYAAMRLGADDVGAILRCEWAAASIFPAAVYAVALAASGSAEVSILAVLLGFALPVGGTPWIRDVPALSVVPWMRSIPAIFSLAFTVGAIRLRRSSWLAIAGGIAIVAGLMSIEFGTYSALLVIVAAIRMRSKRAIGATAAGFAAVAIPVLIVFTIAGFVVDFFRTILLEVLPLSSVYSIGFFSISDRFSIFLGFPDIIALLFQPKTVWIAAWGATAIASAAGLARSCSRRTDPLWFVGVWSMLATISYSERLNTYFMPTIVVFATVAVSILARRTSFWPRVAAVALASVLLVVAMPARHLLAVATQRRGIDPSRADLVRLDEPARARGGLYRADNAQKFLAAKEFVELGLAPGETFFDFANMPILYYLFDLPAPVRQYEVPFFESRDLQLEVIRRLETDRSVHAALVSFPNHGETSIDGVPNSARAPLVWKYLQTHFQPAFARDGVEFWVRR